MQIKRGATLASAVTVAIALVACGSSSSSTSSSSAPSGGSSTAAPTTTASASAQKHYTVAVISGISTDPFYVTLACGAKQAGAALGDTINSQGPQMFAPAQQIPVLDSVIATHPNAILIAPTDPKALYAPLKQAADEGIKIVLVDTTLTNPSIAASQVSEDNLAAGATAAQGLAKLIGDKGQVFVLDVAPGITTTDARAQGFQHAIAHIPGVKSLGIQYDTADSAQQAESITACELASHPDLAGVFAENTFTAQGAATALKQAGKLGKVKLVGFDATAAGVQALQDGTAQAEVVLKPSDVGYDGVVQAVNALSGKPVQKQILTGALLATKANLNSPQVQKYLYRDTCTAA